MSTHLHPLPFWEDSQATPQGAGTSASEAEGNQVATGQHSLQNAHPRRAHRPARPGAAPTIREDTIGQELHLSFLENYGAWGASLGMHILLLFALSLIVLSINRTPPELEIVSIFDSLEEPVLTEIVQPEDTWNTDSNVPVTATVATAVVEKTAKKLDGSILPQSEFGMPEMPDQAMAIAPETEMEDIDEIVPGIQGDVVTTEGDVGSVDRITTEILSALRESKVLVVWLLDASESLRTRREQVIGRFDRVYQELGELSEHEPDALQTSVVGFGKTATLMTKEPTTDPEVLKRAVRGIPVDNSGVENVFSAVHTAALEYRTMARKGYRVMLVILTDESGNDSNMADQAAEVVVQHKMPVYVLGPLAPFGRKEVRIRWVDPQTSEVFHLPVERGPAAAITEYPAKLFTLFSKSSLPALSSGFGPFGLAKLAHQSGGICFVYNDGHIKGPKFDPVVLSDYSPDYVSQAEYQRQAERSPLRSTFLTCSQALQDADFARPVTEFLAAGIQFKIRGSFSAMESSYDALGQVAEAMMSVRQHYAKESSNRWRVHYDLLLGQVLVRRLQIENSVPLLNAMYEKPKACKDVTCNAFALSGIGESSLLDQHASDLPEANSKSASGRELTELQLARLHLERIVRDHPDTPWAIMAQAELESPLAIEWRETFVEPPAGEALPWDKSPKEWKALSKEEQEALEEAKEKFERFRRFRAEQKKKQEEQIRKSAGNTPAKRKGPPNL